eukprot:6132500-Prymnesium_polylepis.1
MSVDEGQVFFEPPFATASSDMQVCVYVEKQSGSPDVGLQLLMHRFEIHRLVSRIIEWYTPVRIELALQEEPTMRCYLRAAFMSTNRAICALGERFPPAQQAFLELVPSLMTHAAHYGQWLYVPATGVSTARLDLYFGVDACNSDSIVLLGDTERR